MLLGSYLFKAAYECAVPSGASLSIDRVLYSNKIKEKLESFENINYVIKKYDKINPDIPTIIATGPLTHNDLAKNIADEFESENFHFYDAVAPIIEKNSIDFNKAFYASRWDKGTADYINCPMDKNGYEKFYDFLINAKRAPLKEFEANYFEGCMPVEVMASRGKDTLRFGPLKPVGLFDGRTPAEFKKNQFYAVVQLRQDDKIASLYNLVGFQTNLLWSEQKEMMKYIPGLENAHIVRYGVMHANTFINSPKILNKYLQTNKYPNIFFAGQITGVEGYCESISTGLLAAINTDRFLKNRKMLELTDCTMLGALVNYITYKNHKKFQPVNSNWGIVKEAEGDKKQLKDKNFKNNLRAERSIKEIESVIGRGV